MSIAASLRQTTPIGVDATPGYVAAAQLRRTRAPGGWALAAAVVIPRPARAGEGPGPAAVDGAEAARIADTLWRCGFRGRDVVLGVPDGALLVSALELPPRSSGAPLEELARQELARAHKCDPGAIESAMWDLPAPARGGSCTHAMAVACPHAAADAHLDAFEDPAGAGFRVRSMDARLLALTRVGALALGDPGEPAMLVDLGESHAMIVVLHGRVPVYQRVAAESGVGRLLEALCSRLGVDRDVAAHALWTIGTGCDPAERVEGMDRMEEARAIIAAYLEVLARDLNAVLEYAAHLYPDARVRRLGIAGAGAAIPGVPAKLGFELSLQAAAIAPADAVLCPPAARRGRSLAQAGRDPRLAVAVGLALAEEARRAWSPATAPIGGPA